MRDGMNDGSPPTDPTPDHPESEPGARDPGALRGFDPALELPSMPPISPDFVARTWQLIRDDRSQIDAEAARVDETSLPRALLDAYTAPPPSDDFVDATLARLEATRSAPQADERLHDALAAYRVPSPAGRSAPGDDFVTRTLAALRLERTRLRAVPAGEEARHTPRPTAPTVAAGRGPQRLAWAALLLGALALGLSAWWGADRGAPTTGPETVVQIDPPTVVPPTAEVFSPAPLATAVASFGEADDVGARLAQGDGLLLFAALEAGGGR